GFLGEDLQSVRGEAIANISQERLDERGGFHSRVPDGCLQRLSKEKKAKNSSTRHAQNKSMKAANRYRM
ncbi:hypothetical protein SARC_06525, partial [Sphaeroforma arctica JP610]